MFSTLFKLVKFSKLIYNRLKILRNTNILEWGCHSGLVYYLYRIIHVMFDVYKWQYGKKELSHFRMELEKERVVSFFIHCKSSAELFLPTDPKQLVQSIQIAIVW